MAFKVAKVVGLVLTVMCWLWASENQFSYAAKVAMIWCSPLLAYPITLAARRTLDARPMQVEWINLLTHYAMMTCLGVGIFGAIALVEKRPGVTIPIPPELGFGLLILSCAGAAITVLNLALRGKGAPFAAKLSSRLATDWMYGWTRNPMVLATLALIFSIGLWHRSLWFVVWMAISVSPALIFFVRRYEERELEIRFGDAYRNYRARTPFLWPRRPLSTPRTRDKEQG
jgi:protein-S-isoprenylcysteine O-methyltransferase Ste14